jgi:hypothetical protein
MPDNEDEATYTLAMPFIVCTSQNGPYDDEPFAAGWTCGALNAELASCRQVAANPRGRHVLPGILPQVDLIAMNHGFTVRRDPERDSPGWVYVEFDQVGCSCA